MKYFFKKYLNCFVIIFLLIIHLVLLVTLKFTAWPEMLTYPWLMLNGYKLYTDIILPYPPLLPLLLKFFYSSFGLSIISLRIFTITIIIFSDILIYLVSKNQLGKKLGIFSLIIFIFSQLFFEGNGLWFELASLPLLLMALFLLQSKKLVFTGLFIGLSILIKQNNVLFIIPALLYLIFNKKSILKFCISAILPFLTVFIYYLSKSNFNDFFYWVIYHPLFIHAKSPGFFLRPSNMQILIIFAWFFPLIIIWKKNLILFVWFIISLIFAFPRFGYFHLQLSVAFFSLLIPYIFNINKKIRYFLLIIYIPLISFVFSKFILKELGKPIRFFTSDVIETRQTLSAIIPKNSTIFFLNVSSEYFVGSELLPVKPWADNFPWYLEVSGVQEKIINSFDKNNVQWVVYKKYNNEGKYVPGSYKPELLDAYINNHYQVKDKINDSISILQRKIDGK
ncbi:MAG: hypothetical protein UR52_C0001G0015 [Candidatus Gottesmanbacteria bacterium GW2011_GWA1_34_13]|uniref:Glycosyltransferase RgtA/B/C/D-like domain-containing protein n=1 Tax=Candidatus Gottesmanbacteria bacterium GW2011_GWA1_34_13 TaxID=1618434 RepID=A0A0G0D9C8_9BACT|nr:MAG: hypothetical protein UR52_C0001G0015 [Candidatus Gottesmanbacteria bacterium GW2011_GWA1_34_13]